MISIFTILIFFIAHILFYRYFKINLLSLFFIFFSNLFIIAILYSYDLSFIFLTLLTFNSFIFCYSIFFTGVTNDSPTLKIIYYLYFFKIKDKKKLEKKFINSDSIESRIQGLYKNELFFYKDKQKILTTKFARNIINLIIYLEKILNLKSDV